jgi:nitrate/nitrite transport system substrate-binding protein
MVAHLRAGQIDGFCVGEPWNTLAVEEGIGRVLISSYEIWNNHPEKVFGVTREWSESYPHTHHALLVSLIEAARWLDEPHNREEAAMILARPEYVRVPASILRAGLLGQFRFGRDDAPTVVPDFHVFHRYAANFPWVSHGEWLITQMLRWGQIKPPVDIQSAAAQVYRPDLYRQAAAALDLPCPPANGKPEGLHEKAWMLATHTDTFNLGPDRFFDGGVFRPVGDQSPVHRRAAPRRASDIAVPGRSP